MKNIDYVFEAVKEYLETALWSSTDEDGAPLDIAGYKVDDIDSEDVKRSFEDIVSFMDSAGELVAGMPAECLGHNLWLNRNGHGAGFWSHVLIVDLSNAKRWEQLSDLAKAMGETDLYLGDDGKLHLS